MYQLLGYLSGIISLLELPPYLRDIFRRTTRPQRTSWFIWSLLGSVAFASQFAEGARASLWMTGAETLGALGVFIISLYLGEGDFSKRDALAIFIACIGLILWYLTRHAAFALFFVILVDAAGTALTLVKAYQDPDSETLSAWMFASLAGAFAAGSVGEWNFTLLAYPVYIFSANLAICLAIFFGKRRVPLGGGNFSSKKDEL